MDVFYCLIFAYFEILNLRTEGKKAKNIDTKNVTD